VCDTLCLVGPERTLFAKNSDRPPHEVQVVEGHPRRGAGGTRRTQYLDLPDPGAVAAMLSRPEWLRGCEHGVNEHGVAVGNEKIWTVDDARSVPPALLGMDLVRLALEGATTADEAFDLLTGLLEEHGQGGTGEQDHDEPYFSSFLIADRTSGWVVETSNRTWAARPVRDGASISNRISLTTDWTRASDDVPPGRDFQSWRDQKAPTGIADHRLGATGACVATAAAGNGIGAIPADLVATLRHHGTRPWGAPRHGGAVEPVPTDVHDDWSGVTVCMHVRDYQATTAAMVAELPREPEAPLRAWVALGSPCASVFVPVFPPLGVPPALAEAASWQRFAALRERVEQDADALEAVRAVLAPVEDELWDRADHAAEVGTEAARADYLDAAWGPVDAGLARLDV
jgi:secernin